ncbi:DMT family transporter [Roseibium algae]|uniref:DMT family transporter n=1 Tax=Roseibium algae TaxID=3123038 RepID=A0ABU8TI86_9HYPH
MAFAASLFRQHVFGNAFLLLILTTLMWGGNTVAGRLAIGEVSPMAVVSLRWFIVAFVMVCVTRTDLKEEWPLVRTNLGRLILMATFGFTGFNTLFYIAAHHTTAVNLGIIQGAMPVLVLIGAVLTFGVRVRALQVLGILITLAGVAMVAAQGDLQLLLNLSVNPGDGIMLIACLFYACYTLSLRARPKISGMVFFTVLSIIAALTSLPGFFYELATHTLQMPTPKGWLIVLYISLFPSSLAQIFFMRGVELIGPSRTGVFINLVPIFAAGLAILILGEPFHTHHAIALVLVLGGIWLSERKASPK